MTDDPKKLYDRASGNDTTKTAAPSPILHVRVQGRSRDIALDLLGIHSGSPDETIRNSVAQFMEIALASLRNTVVERHENGNITLRPEAVFG